MVGGLGITIAANFWFLYVVFLCFQWMNAHDGGEDKPTSTFIEERSVTAAKPVIVDGITGTPSPSNTTNSTSNSNHRNVTAKLLNQPPSLLTRPEIRLPVPPLKFRSGVSYYADHGRYRPRLPA
ncbi:hypothetical protein AB6A40_010397 [Gnathostoma spinigerum]|uniref:ATP synthase F0 subunit 8 n=1 Tax=Gnathostoma spinigerum TaxID=75299 RepID=A0ABD6EV55_9BILA